jgi:hypothetical protein
MDVPAVMGDIMAAARLNEKIPDEKERLLKRVLQKIN